MRKVIMVLALASVAAPAMAQRNEGWAERRAARVEQRQQESASEASRAEQPQEVLQPRISGAERQSRFEGEPRGWQRSQQVQAPQAAQPERGARGVWNRSDDGQRDTMRTVDPAQVARWRERQEQRRAEQVRDGSVPATRWSDRVREVPRSGEASSPSVGSAPAIRYGTRDGVRTRDGSWDRMRSRDGQWREGAAPAEQYRGGRSAQHYDRQRDGRRWSDNWRRDSRYDWRRYRDRNRSVFRVGVYHDPFGWGYRPLSIGYRLSAGYYRSNFWLDDPWQYRLPPVYGPYRWVRYHDDAVLVDIWSGEVVEVIRNFFW